MTATVKTKKANGKAKTKKAKTKKKVVKNRKEAPYVALGGYIAKHRAKLGLTQEQFSKQLRWSRSSLANIESGRQRTYLSDAVVIAKALKVKPTELFAASIATASVKTAKTKAKAA